MTNVNGNSNLSNLYTMYTELNNLKGSKKNRKQNKIDDLASQAGAKLFDVTGGENGGVDGKLRYDDIITLMKGVDLDGDGEVSDDEKNFIMDLLNGKVSKKANIKKQYKQDNDKSLDSAKDFSELNYLLENCSSDDTTDTKLGKVLTSISKEYVQNMYGIKKSNSGWLTQNNVNALTNLETQLDAINDYTNQELADSEKPTDEQMKSLFGETFDLSSLGGEDDDTISNLETAINAVKDVMGLNKTLSTSNQSKLDKLRTASGVDSWEDAVSKQQFNCNTSYFGDGVGSNVNFSHDLNGDGTFDFKDIIQLATADFDGDGQTSEEEEALANSFMTEMLDKYKNDTTALANATTNDLVNLMGAIKNCETIWGKNSKLYKKLESIQVNIKSKSLGLKEEGTTAQHSVNVYTNLEAKLEAVKAYLNPNLEEGEKPTDEQMKILFGEDVDLSTINNDYAANLRTIINSIKPATSLIEKLKTNSPVTTWEDAVAKQTEINSMKENPVLKKAIENLSNEDKACLYYDDIDLTETFSNGKPKYALSGKHIYKFKEDEDWIRTVLNSTSTRVLKEYDSSSPIYHTSLITATKSTKEVDTGVIDKNTLLNPDLDPDEEVPDTTAEKIYYPPKTTTTEIPAKYTYENVESEVEETKGQIDSAIAEILKVDGNVLENANDVPFGTQEAIDEFKDNNQYAQTSDEAIAEAKDKFLNTVKAHIETTLGETLANEFARICIDEFPAEKTEAEFNALPESQKDDYKLTPEEIKNGTYKLTAAEEKQGMDIRYKKYASTYASEKEARTSITNNFLDKIFGYINLTKPTTTTSTTEGYYDYPKVRNDKYAQTITDTVTEYSTDKTKYSYTPKWDQNCYCSGGYYYFK